MIHWKWWGSGNLYIASYSTAIMYCNIGYRKFIGKLSEIYQTYIGNLSEIYQKFIGHLSGIYRTSIYRKYIRNFIGHQSDIYRTSIYLKYIRNFSYRTFNYVSRYIGQLQEIYIFVYQKHIGHLIIENLLRIYW